MTNPTILAGEGGSGCTTMNLGHVQSWYNLTVAVTPGDSSRALFGGDLCSAVTVDGGATYQLASDWLPQSGLGFTNNGFLGYVHADWHTSLALRIGGRPVLLVGTDGGIFVTRNIWDVPTPELGSWSQPDVGLATHLFYGIGTGDPTLGNPNVVFGGLQDNGTRWRLISDEAFIAEFNSGNWDRIPRGRRSRRGRGLGHQRPEPGVLDLGQRHAALLRPAPVGLQPGHAHPERRGERELAQSGPGRGGPVPHPLRHAG